MPYLCCVKVLAVTLMLCFCYQMMARLGVVAWYEINKDYVATVLCENRDKPEMKCCGKCYLRKQLNNTGDNENTPGKAQLKWEKLNWVAILPLSKKVPLYNTDIVKTDLNGYYKGLLSLIAAHSIFHPPSARFFLA